MENVTQKELNSLEEFVKVKQLNKQEIETILLLSISLLEGEEAALGPIVDAIAGMHFAIIPPFTKEVLLALEGAKQAKLIKLFLASDKISANRAHYGLRRIVLMLNSLLTLNEAQGFAHVLLKDAARHYREKGSNKAIDGLMVEKLTELFQLDYSVWNRKELAVLVEWLQAIAEAAKENALLQKYATFKEKWLKGEKKSEPRKTERSKQKPPPPTKEEHGRRLVGQLSSLLDRLHNDIARYKELEKRAKAELEKAQRENAKLNLQVSSLAEQNRVMEGQVYQLEIKHKSLTRQNAELNARLERVFAADENQAKFEIDAYKSDLARRLRPDYDDFLRLADFEPTPDYFKALLVLLEGVFDTLRRKGIRFPGMEGH